MRSAFGCVFHSAQAVRRSTSCRSFAGSVIAGHAQRHRRTQNNNRKGKTTRHPKRRSGLHCCEPWGFMIFIIIIIMSSLSTRSSSPHHHQELDPRLPHAVTQGTSQGEHVPKCHPPKTSDQVSLDTSLRSCSKESKYVSSQLHENGYPQDLLAAWPIFVVRCSPRSKASSDAQ